MTHTTSKLMETFVLEGKGSTVKDQSKTPIDPFTIKAIPWEFIDRLKRISKIIKDLNKKTEGIHLLEQNTFITVCQTRKVTLSKSLSPQQD